MSLLTPVLLMQLCPCSAGTRTMVQELKEAEVRYAYLGWEGGFALRSNILWDSELLDREYEAEGSLG